MLSQCLRSVLQCTLENHFEGLVLQPMPEGAHEEVNDGVGTAVNSS
uniref:Uncharacterized protein n=1 Tax=Trichinella nativa TaxID=6335 RepID=A0A0V1KI84_9BILA